jgi:Zn-finger nucleic acid-binding protein
MICPNCKVDLVTSQHDGMEVDSCPKCEGLWLTALELQELEDEAFDLGDDGKGTLVFSSEPSARQCPQCAKSMRTFEYRDYDLELEFCPEGHGYWLDANEDKRVKALIGKEEDNLSSSYSAEEKWTADLKYWRSGRFLDRVKAWAEGPDRRNGIPRRPNS